jgi:hypothetical protein
LKTEAENRGRRETGRRGPLGSAPFSPCGKYLPATRMGSVSEIKEEALTRPGRFRTIAENLLAKEVTVGNGEFRRRNILCFNPRGAQRERRHREQVVKELEEELENHPDHEATARGIIYFLASGRYNRSLTIDKQRRIRIDREAIQQASKYDGKWVLLTNGDTIHRRKCSCGL